MKRWLARYRPDLMSGFTLLAVGCWLAGGEWCLYGFLAGFGYIGAGMLPDPPRWTLFVPPGHPGRYE